MGNLVGRSLAHFHIEAKLGEGGMGVVYRATDEKLRRQVALKVLPDSFAKDEDRRKRFLREARSAAAVTHANIATVHEVGEAEGHVFIAMELVEGETLRARMEQGITLAESLRVATEIARGLSRAHEKGVVHRDLKPENVMISRHNEVKILDFGLAKLHEERATPSVVEEAETETNLTRDGRVLGTPAYMAPEQARGQDLDARADVLRSVSCSTRWRRANGHSSGPRRRTCSPPSCATRRDRPSDSNPRVPADVGHIIERCLEKLRDARYADGQELLVALERLNLSADGAPRRSVPETAAVMTRTDLGGRPVQFRAPGEGANAAPERAARLRLSDELLAGPSLPTARPTGVGQATSRLRHQPQSAARRGGARDRRLA